MNKNLRLKLGSLLLLSLTLIACEQKDNISKSSSNKYNNETQDSIKKEETNPDVKEETNPDVKEETNPNIKQSTSREQLIVAGGYNTVVGVCEYYLYDLFVTKRIEPSIFTSTSSYYDVKTEGNIYIDIIIEVNNLSNESKLAEDLISARIKINNNEYNCFSLVESIDESDLEKDASIKPLEPRKIHYVAEVPIADSTGELEIILTVNGNEFSNNFNLTQSSVKEITPEKRLTEEEYYIIIKEAKQRQQDYIDSIDDPKVKQSVQTSFSAAIAESTSLYIKYPTDISTIDKALKRVLNGEWFYITIKIIYILMIIYLHSDIMNVSVNTIQKLKKDKY